VLRESGVSSLRLQPTGCSKFIEFPLHQQTCQFIGRKQIFHCLMRIAAIRPNHLHLDGYHDDNPREQQGKLAMADL
jgi:hypothetical protein